MPWINLARLLAYLRRRRIDPRQVTVYLDDEVDTGFRRPLSRYSEPSIARGDERLSYDDGEDEDEDD